MITCNCIRKFRNRNNVIYGYRLVDTQGNTQDVVPEQLKNAIKNKQVYVNNLQLTSDGRLVDKAIDKLQNKQIFSKSPVIANKDKYEEIIAKVCKQVGIPRGTSPIRINNAGVVVCDSGASHILGEDIALYFEFGGENTVKLTGKSIEMKLTGIPFSTQVNKIHTIVNELKDIQYKCTDLGFKTVDGELKVEIDLAEDTCGIEYSTPRTTIVNDEYWLYFSITPFESERLVQVADPMFGGTTNIKKIPKTIFLENDSCEINYSKDYYDTQIKKIAKLLNMLRNIEKLNNKDFIRLCVELSNHSDEASEMLISNIISGLSYSTGEGGRDRIINYLRISVNKLVEKYRKALLGIINEINDGDDYYFSEDDIKYIAIYCLLYNRNPEVIYSEKMIDGAGMAMIRDNFDLI